MAFEIPDQTLFYPLRAEAIGGPFVEGLTGYLRRLASAHGVTVPDFISHSHFDQLFVNPADLRIRRRLFLANGFCTREAYMTIETRRTAAARRAYMEYEIETAVRQMRIDGATLEDCEAELHLLADFVRAKADGLRAAWTDLMKGTVWELNQQGRSVSDAINEGLAVERKPD